jgi:hypothetical protein
VVGLQDDAAAAPAVAAARPALGDVSLAMERDATFAAVPRLRVNFYFVNEHEIFLIKKVANGTATSSGVKLSPPHPSQVIEAFCQTYKCSGFYRTSDQAEIRFPWTIRPFFENGKNIQKADSKL